MKTKRNSERWQPARRSQSATTEALSVPVVRGLVVVLSVILILSCRLFPPASAQSHSAHPAAAAGFQALSAQAGAARDAQQLDKAAELYHKALRLNPRWAEGWWSLATIDYDADRYASAANAFQHVVKLAPRQGTARAMLGLCEFELGQNDAALRDIEAGKALGINEDEQLRQVVLFHEGVLLQRAGRFYAAQRALASVCFTGVRNQVLAQTLGLVVLRKRDVAPPSPGTADAEVVERLGMAACEEGEKKYDIAKQGFADVVAKYPHYPSIHYAYGRFLLDDGERDAAIKEFQRQIAEDPSDLLSRLLIAATEIRVNDAAGIPYAKEAVRMAPNAPLAHFILGSLLLDVGDDQGAVTHLEIASKAFPKEPRLLWSLASAYARVGRTKDAAQTRAAFLRLRTAANSNPNTPLEITDSMVPAPLQ